ncbi:hypothetical protein NPIL_354251 [Nephila pilipes]|uniref:Uncharacterized protein n=1 Tax=Nephila pilipes TaxID=299642 RepID=A0A8X6NE26_NEPPI|nr:hypothetical protein NPIL_354251 [Nephila pilipes]
MSQETGVEAKIDESFMSTTCSANDLKVTALTIVSTNDVKGVQISVGEEGVRLYKILNGTVAMVFNKETFEKYCRVAASIANNFEVDFSDVSEDLS